MKKEMSGEKKKVPVFLTLAASFLVAFMGSGLNPAIPDISREFGLRAAESGWVITAYMLPCSALPIPFGCVAGAVNRKKILTIGLGVFMTASAGGLVAGSLGILLIMRALQGAGTAMIYSTSMSILVSGGESSERGRLLGYSTAATYLGLSTGPVLGGILSSQFGWRCIFAVTAGGSAVTFFSGAWMLRRDGCSRKLPSGFPSVSVRVFPSYQNLLLYISSVLLVLTGMNAAASSGWGLAALFFGVLLLLLFVIRQKKQSGQVLSLNLFCKHPVFRQSCLISMIHFGTNFVIQYLLALFLQVSLGYSVQTTGMILGISPAIQTVLSPAVGKISDGRIKPYTLSAAGMAGMAISAAAFGMFAMEVSLLILCVGLACTGIFCALFAAPNTSMVMESAGKQNYSMAAAVLSTMRSLGNSIGIASASLVSGAVLGSGTLQRAAPLQILLVMRYTFFFWSILCFLGFLVALKKKM